VCKSVFICIVCVWLRVAVFQTCSCDPNPATGDPDPIRICIHYGPDTMEIRKPAHGMIRRSVLVRAVKTRRRFSFETASFHVSVCFCLFPYLPLLINTCGLFLSFHVTV